MLNIKSAALIMLALSASAHAELTSTQKALYLSAQTATVLDWSQTRTIAKNPDRFQEANPLIGKNPSAGKVDAFMAARMVGNHFAAHYIPDDYRTPALIGMNAVYWGVVIHNHKLGVEFDHQDKLKHAGMSFAFGSIAKSAGFSDWQAIGLAMIPGTMKELHDSRKGSGWSNRDMVANAIGAVIGVKDAGWMIRPEGDKITVSYSTEF